jgi:hypothetical protein
MRFLRRAELAFKEIPWIASNCAAGLIDPIVAGFCRELMSGGHEPAKHILLLPEHRLIYVAIPKAASTRIRRTLARVEGRFSRSLKPSKRCNYRGPYGPRNMSMHSFYDLASSPATLRFSFVRNPYARMVSSWADKFSGKPLVPGDPFIDYYLGERSAADPRLPKGAERSLSFADFVRFTSDVPEARRDSHIQTQSAILDIPGLHCTFIGKVESFDADFARVLDFLNASDEVRSEAAQPINESHHEDWPAYYTADLADRVYRTYEADFDSYGYLRALPRSVRGYAACCAAE